MAHLLKIDLVLTIVTRLVGFWKFLVKIFLKISQNVW